MPQSDPGSNGKIEMTIEKDRNKKLYRTIQDRDPRDVFSILEIPTEEQHQEKIVNRLKRVKISSEKEEMALEISKWTDMESCR